jgi:uncharacterized protein involved in exopolysaccharide biosynthesis
VLVSRIARHSKIVAVITLLFVIVTAGITMFRAPRYTAQSIFMPQSRSNSAAGLTGIAAQLGVAVPTGDPSESPVFYADLIQTRTLLAAVVDSGYTLNSSGRVRHSLVQFLHGKGKTPALQRDDAIKRLRKDISADVEPRTSSVNLSVTLENPEVALQVNQEILLLVNEFNLTRRQSVAGAERRFTEQQMRGALSDLRAAEDREQAFLQNNREYRNSPELTFQQDRLQRDVTLKQTIYNTLAQSYEQAKVDEVRNTPLITTVEPASLPLRQDPRGVITNVLLALVIGLLVGAFAALGLDAIQRYREEADVERIGRAGTPTAVV